MGNKKTIICGLLEILAQKDLLMFASIKKGIQKIICAVF